MSLIKKSIVVAGLALFAMSQQAPAAVLYDNEAVGHPGAYYINGSNIMANSFTLSSASTVTGVTFVSWVTKGYGANSLSSVNWSIQSSGPNWSDHGTSTPVTSTFTQELGGWYVDSNTFSTGSVFLGPGTYYLQLGNAIDQYNSQSVAWEISWGPSAACYNAICTNYPSEQFQILGDVSATPLPAALPLFATGLGVMGLLGWRRKRKGAAAVAA